mmetsp:Transcript_43286/g.77793  ORF Transcript_43286/g.77793 Transcript_43286/m.77793 type:complete len:390 (+) Transcript_43286:17-1186(+)
MAVVGISRPWSSQSLPSPVKVPTALSSSSLRALGARQSKSTSRGDQATWALRAFLGNALAVGGFTVRMRRGGAGCFQQGRERTLRLQAAVQEGDVIAVVGAGGNVGRLVTQRLCSLGKYRVRGVLRDAERARNSWARDVEGLELFEADTRDALALSASLCDANAVVCTTGVPAFGISGQWKDGNHPESVDHFGVKNTLFMWSSGSGPKRKFVLMSSIGVTRRDGFPYSVLNGGGVLDAKAKGEAALLSFAAKKGFAATIVRPGQLFGGPYENNRYLGTLFQLDKDEASRAVKLVPGDTAVGDTLRSSLAGVLVRCLLSDREGSVEFAVVNEEGPPPPEEDIDKMLQQLTSSPDAATSAPDEQMGKRLDMAQKTFGQAVENVVSGKMFDP